MLFFRSEERLQEWLASYRAPRGAVLTVPQLWELSQRWYYNRLSPEYRGRDVEDIQAIFQEVGLTSGFWRASE